MHHIAVQQKERKYLFLNKHFTTGIPKEPKFNALNIYTRNIQWNLKVIHKSQ